MNEQILPSTASAEQAFRVAAAQGVTLTKWTRAWEERFAAIPLSVVRSSDESQTALLQDGSADVSFVRLPIDDAGLSVIPLYAESPVAVLPKGHALADRPSVTMADLAGETHIGGAWDEAISVVAANVGVVVVPQSIARLHGRKDVVAVAVSDAPETQIAIAWLTAAGSEWIEEFVGIVRGRTARSSRGASGAAEATDESKKAKAKAKTSGRGAAGATGKNGKANGGRSTTPPKGLAANRAAANKRRRQGR